MVLVVVCAVAGALGVDAAAARRSGSGSPRRSSPRSASGWPCCSSSARRHLTILGAHARSGGALGRIGRGAACSRRSRSPGGSSSASTPASASPRRRATRRARSRARSGSRCSASPRSSCSNAVAIDARAPRPRRRRRRRGRRPGHDRGRDVVRLLVRQAVRGGRARRVPRVRHRRPVADRARRSTRSRATTCCPAPGFLRRVDRRGSPVGGIVDDRRRRVPRTAARPELGRGRQPDRVRHGGDLRRLPARRARGADRTAARAAGRRAGTCGSAAPGSASTSLAVGVAGVRDRQHRLAAHVAGPAGCARATRSGRRRWCSRRSRSPDSRTWCSRARRTGCLRSDATPVQGSVQGGSPMFAGALSARLRP